MDIVAAIGSTTTVVSFVAFVGIVVWAWSGRRERQFYFHQAWFIGATFVAIVLWAYSRRRKREFEEAANAPFALPDDATGVAAPRAPSGERQS